MPILQRHLLACLALTLLTPIARADDLLQSGPTTKGGGDPIAINLPKSWKERPHDSSATLLVAGPASPDTDTTGDYTPVIIIRSTPRPNSAGPINGDAQQARVADEMTNYDITEKPSTTSINGLDAVTFGGTFTQGALKLRSRQYFILANDHLYSLTLITLASTWEQHLPALEASIRTFTLSTKK
ncbi:MAG TPA: hypothetical protein VM008_06885 [Phycisphaerae bacterium]|nr:hypothetical protein [Phycisphaerae bacterium]